MVPGVKKFSSNKTRKFKVRSLKHFEKELLLLSECDAIFVPGKSDQVILALFGLSSVYFPYMPTAVRSVWLESVRQARLEKPGQTILVIGSAHNTPTILGMEEQLKWLQGLRGVHVFA